MTVFINLTKFDESKEKEVQFFNEKNKYFFENQSDFLNIPENTICYWMSKKIIELFNKELLGDFAKVKKGMDTSNNKYFLKIWFEVDFNKIGFNYKNLNEFEDSFHYYAPYNKGGSFRKWYGNKEWIIYWKNRGDEIKKSNGNLRSTHLYFKDSITWSAVGAKIFNARLSDYGAIFDSAGSSCFPNSSNHILYFLSFFNSKLFNQIVNSLNPTINFGAGTVSKIPISPIIKPSHSIDKIIELTNNCIEIAKNDWDSRETSWDFKTNPLLTHKIDTQKIKDAYQKYCEYWIKNFHQLHKNEEELNQIFIDIYDLIDELTPKVPLEDITILKEETNIKNKELVFKKDVIIKKFISYAIGCMFGRYSPETEGLIVANQGEMLQDFKEKVPNTSFTPDDDNIIPVLGDEYFEDDIVFRFKEFLKVTYGQENLSENLDFIAIALSPKSNDSPEQIIRKYLMNDFFKDHCKMYKKRPIYWLFTSGPEKAFNALIYMHRYDKTTLAKMRTDYLNELQAKLEAKKSTLKLDSTDNLEKNRAQQDLVKINKQLEETVEYHKLLKNKGDQYIEIDLDDGVNVNYEKFKGLVAKV